MIVPAYWAEARLQQRTHRRQITVRRFGWSDLSLAEAQAHAQARVREAFDRVVAGEKLPRLERKVGYGGSQGLPIREEIVDRHGEAVITRNSYGALCLNTPDVLFVDVDFDEPVSDGLSSIAVVLVLIAAVALGLWQRSAGLGIAAFFVGLIVALFVVGRLRKRAHAANGGPERRARERIDAFAAQRPDWHLARLRLSRQLLELSEQDLRLTHEEAQTLLQHHSSSLRGEALDNLIQRSEGWVAGLRFWLLAAAEAGTEGLLPQSLHGGEGLIRDYLLEEVIDCLPAEVQAFLYDTAPQERFCSALCDAVREAHDSAEILRYLASHQVFLVPLDEHGHWYRYHHLFSDLLRSRPSAPAMVPAATLHLRACRWFNAQGLIDEAVEQALRAGHLDVAANLVQNLSEEQLLAEQNVGMLLRWKMDLPDSLLISTPRLIVLYSWALGLACQLDAAEELAAHLSRFLPAPSATAQKSMLAQWLALSGIVARGRGDREATVRYCSEALESLPQKRYGQRLMCLSTMSNLAIADGDLWRARGLNRDSLELAQRVGNPLFEALAHYDRARVLQARGEIQRALDEVHQGLQRLHALSPQRLYAVRARLTLYEGFLLTLRMQPQAGLTRLQAGLTEARACRDISVLLGHCVIARIEGNNGEFARAFAELAEAERLMHIWDVPPIYYLAMITLVKCELWLAQGRTDLAEAWLSRLGQTYTGERAAAPPEFHPQLPLHVELQQALLESIRGQPMLAEGRLNALLEQGQQTGRQMLSVMALNQKVALLLGLGREPEARRALAQAFEAAAGGVLQPFEWLLGEHREWLREQLLHAAPGPVREQLLERLPSAVALPAEPSTPVETLSSRERAVLQLIAQGCSNQEISEQLFISLHTVKTHASHINSKLGVERRTQAVARAKALGLLG